MINYAPFRVKVKQGCNSLGGGQRRKEGGKKQLGHRFQVVDSYHHAGKSFRVRELDSVLVVARNDVKYVVDSGFASKIDLPSTKKECKNRIITVSY